MNYKLEVMGRCIKDSDEEKFYFDVLKMIILNILKGKIKNMLYKIR